MFLSGTLCSNDNNFRIILTNYFEIWAGNLLVAGPYPWNPYWKIPGLWQCWPHVHPEWSSLLCWQIGLQLSQDPSLCNSLYLCTRDYKNTIEPLNLITSFLVRSSLSSLQSSNLVSPWHGFDWFCIWLGIWSSVNCCQELSWNLLFQAGFCLHLPQSICFVALACPIALPQNTWNTSTLKVTGLVLGWF